MRGLIMEYKLIRYYNNIGLITKEKKEKYVLVKKMRSKIKYIQFDRITCLDTETSHTKDESMAWIYHWGINIGNKVYRGRTISELITFLSKVVEKYDINDKKRLIIYVHNLSYDITYLEKHLEKEFGIKDRLDVKSRKTLYYITRVGIEFRCSYLLTNMSLDKFSKNMKVKQQKLTGTVDHNITRYPSSKLTVNDIKYMYYDVISLSESLTKKIKLDGDTLATVPLTSTGYVRNYCRKEAKKDRAYMKAFQESKPTYEEYMLLEKAYKGGYTHSNYTYRDKHLKGDIAHYDFRSHYPSVLMLETYPLGKFKDLEIKSIEELKELNKKYCMLITFTIQNFYLKKNRYFPLLQSEDAKKQGLKEKKDYINNNGRIFACKVEATFTLTYEDFEIVNEQYRIEEIKIHAVKASKRGEAPRYIKRAILAFFVGKTKYKGVDDYMCMKNKELLNSIYGMLCTKLVRDEIEYDEQGIPSIHVCSREEREKRLEDYYSNKNSFCMYQIGVWVTAYARQYLFRFIKMIGEDKCIYCDTDSIFFFRTKEAEQRINIANKYMYNKAIKKGAYIKYNNKVVNLGAFVDEKDDIKEFKVLHSKCYCTVNKYDVLNVTIAGVTKKGRHNNTIEKELVSIDNLEDNFIFNDCGGTSSKYTNRTKIILYDTGSEQIEIGNGCIIRNVTKQIKSLQNQLFI